METTIVDGITVITASEGKIFQRVSDSFYMDNVICIGTDHSTGTPREDKSEYYIEVDPPVITEGE